MKYDHRGEPMARWPVASLVALSVLSSNAYADGEEESPQARFRYLGEQISSYRPCIADMARQGKAEAAEALNRIDALNSQASKAAAEQRFGAANQSLAEAYQIAIDSITRLQAGQTVTSRLNFKTPEQEYRYELNRFQSNEILVDMMLHEGHADEGERRGMVASHIRDGKKLYESAGHLAAKGDYRSAITTMEKASMQMNLALRMMGIPSF